jgi:peptidylprolyl isomerase
MPALVLAPLVAATAVLAACSQLTAPPQPEAIQAETPPAPAPQPQPQAQQAEQPKPAPAPEPPKPAAPARPVQKKDLAPGKGDPIGPGDTISVHYTGTLTADHKKFDSSRDRNEPLSFTVGVGMIEGFSQGVVGMKLGGKRKITIPWELAYGEAGRPPVIPPKSDLDFDIELVEIKHKAGAPGGDPHGDPHGHGH